MDLKPLSNFNTILKYADDVTLLVPEYSSTPMQAELLHILDWSSKNKLIVNKAKTKESFFTALVCQPNYYQNGCLILIV